MYKYYSTTREKLQIFWFFGTYPARSQRTNIFLPGRPEGLSIECNADLVV